MTETTTLDRAHAAMEAAPDDSAARLRFFERLADAELFLLLKVEPEGENLDPQVFDLSEEAFVLAFDREERLAQFVGKPAPYAALSGRVLVSMLAGQGVGLGFNLDVAPSQTLLPPAALDWLNDTLAHQPEALEARAIEFSAPKGLPDALLTSLDVKLTTAAGLVRCAYLVGVTYDSGARGHLLGFVGAVEGAEGALAKAASEALAFSGIEAGAIDVAFFRASDPAAAKLAKAGLRFDIPEPETSEMRSPSAPGMDPSRPPKLK